MPTLRFVINGQEIIKNVDQAVVDDPGQLGAVVEEAQRQGQDTQLQQQTTTQTTTSDTPGALPITKMSAILAQKVPGAVAPAVRAVGERTLDPALRLAQGEGSTLENVADAAQLGAGIAQPGLSAMGAGVQAISDSMGMNLDTARALSGLAEVGAQAHKFVGVGTRAVKAGKRLLGAAREVLETEPGAADLLPRERLTTNLVNGVRNTIGTVRRSLKGDFNRMELEVARNFPRINPNDPGYAMVRNAVLEAQKSAAKLDGRSMRILERLDTLMHPPRPDMPGQPVPTRLLVKLRKTLRDQVKFVNADSPDADATGRKAKAIRGLVNQALESAMPDELLGRWQEAKTAYRTQVAEPFRALRTVLSQNSTPQQGFQAVFQGGDPNVFRTVLRLSENSPAVRGRLRLGYLETLREATGDFQDAEKMQAQFAKTRPIIAASGLFTPEELSSFELILRRRALPGVTEALTGFLTARGMVRLGVAQGIGFMITKDPSILPIAAIAAGALPQLRRLTMLPVGSSEGRKLALQAINQITKFASGLNSDSMESPDTFEIVDDES